MKRVLYMLLATTILVACSEDKSAAEKQMTDYKAEWVEITSVVDAQAVEEMGFDAWYNTLTNSDVRDLDAAKEAFDASYEEVEHWYKSLSDGEQEAARAAGEKWEKDNPALQTQIELFEAYVVGNEDVATRELVKLCLSAETVTVEEVEQLEEVTETSEVEVAEEESDATSEPVEE